MQTFGSTEIAGCPHSGISRSRVDDYGPFGGFVCSMLEQDRNCRSWAGLRRIRSDSESRRTATGLIVLDLGLPTLNGIEAVDEFASSHPNPKYSS